MLAKIRSSFGTAEHLREAKNSAQHRVSHIEQLHLIFCRSAEHASKHAEAISKKIQNQFQNHIEFKFT
jgi:hypothetical protein